jgi:hypothetical protein
MPRPLRSPLNERSTIPITSTQRRRRPQLWRRTGAGEECDGVTFVVCWQRERFSRCPRHRLRRCATSPGGDPRAPT